VIFLGRLEDKVAIITGCARGFGKAIAELYAREGAAVSICDIVPVSELENKTGRGIEAAGGRVLCFQVDVTHEDEVNSMVQSTIEKLGRVDILVNNVGIPGPTKDCWNISLAEWSKTIAGNLNGTFLYAKAVLPHMIRNRKGRIINISSVTGKSPLPHRTPYATSKMGIIGFTRTLATEVGKYNVTVNAICPGSPGGERNVELARDLASYLGKTFDDSEYRKQIEAQGRTATLAETTDDGILIGAAIKHEDVAFMAVFLASEEASMITGQDINVCAGGVMW
jgi:NAD(P)-dependent dehydrogenase (short-subunit alcohol dehydrogenase family)